MCSFLGTIFLSFSIAKYQVQIFLKNFSKVIYMRDIFWLKYGRRIQNNYLFFAIDERYICTLYSFISSLYTYGQVEINLLRNFDRDSKWMLWQRSIAHRTHNSWCELEIEIVPQPKSGSIRFSLLLFVFDLFSIKTEVSFL